MHEEEDEQHCERSEGVLLSWRMRGDDLVSMELGLRQRKPV